MDAFKFHLFHNSGLIRPALVHVFLKLTPHLEKFNHSVLLLVHCFEGQANKWTVFPLKEQL